MSNNVHVNDDEIEIHQLPEVSTLQAGMMVAVDSQPTGTKSFNLTNALENKASTSDLNTLAATVSAKANESDLTALATTVNDKADASTVNQLSTVVEGKIDSPATGPVAKQVLTFDGANNVWADAPESVYVLNLSDVNNYTDIDLARANSQPTYIRIDETYGDVTIDIPYNNGSTTVQTNYPVVLKAGTTLKLSYIKEGNNEFVFTSVYADGFYGGGPIGSYGTLFPMLYIRNDNGYLYKWFKVSGELNNGSLNGGMPVPFTKYYHNSRGNGNIASDRNAVEIQFQWDGNIRKQCLLPGEIVNHDFSHDETPEQIQFMGWGATSNRAGYKTINEVPTSVAGDSGKVLTVDSNGTPGWGNAIGFINNVGALTDAATITASNLNNGFATLSTSQPTLTIVDVVETDEVVNFAIEITPSVNCTLSIQKQIGSGTPVTLKHSVAAGNELEAGKTYQVTAVGTCWTLGEFEA